jgi:hypothetical protein
METAFLVPVLLSVKAVFAQATSTTQLPSPALLAPLQAPSRAVTSATTLNLSTPPASHALKSQFRTHALSAPITSLKIVAVLVACRHQPKINAVNVSKEDMGSQPTPHANFVPVLLTMTAALHAMSSFSAIRHPPASRAQFLSPLGTARVPATTLTLAPIAV